MVHEWFIWIEQTTQLIPLNQLAQSFIFLVEMLLGGLNDLVHVQPILVPLLNVVLNLKLRVKRSNLQLQSLQLTKQFVIFKDLFLSQFWVSVNQRCNELQQIVNRDLAGSERLLSLAISSVFFVDKHLLHYLSCQYALHDPAAKFILVYALVLAVHLYVWVSL